MDEKKLKALAAEVAEGLKTEADLHAFSRMLTKLTVETALNTELADHPGYEKNAPKTGSNTHNGYSSKTVLCNNSEIELNTPRDRENTFEPQLIKKHQTRITQMDRQILSLCAKGMTTREIVATFKEMYDSDVSPTLISKVTDAVKEQVIEWQTDKWIRCIPLFIWTVCCQSSSEWQCDKQSSFPCAGDQYRRSESVAGMWLSGNEGTKFWLSVLMELKKRGLQDILIACVDGLKGFPDAINSVFPKYPQISKSWRAHWENLNTLFSYPPDIRKIYTTNAVESLNSVIRAAIKKRKVFPADDSVRKVIYLAIKDASKKWSMPIQNWRLAMSRFIIEFGDRLSNHL
ncbi:TnpA, pseudogene [Salmonella enterica subsp. enterica serovar Bovismorbificans str. 3114]|nr:TnpA, pseudogene [Salmonella enterica subsp. enterica serovar Bovismorbificans str. 3114]